MDRDQITLDACLRLTAAGRMQYPPMREIARAREQWRQAGIQAAREALAEIPDVRMDRVRQLQEQIDAGTFDCEVERLAWKLTGETDY